MEPIFDDTTESIYYRLPEHFRRVDVAQDYALKKYIAGTGANLNVIEKMIGRFDYNPPEDGGDPNDTSDLVDPRTANVEWLPWLAQMLGVRLRGKVSDDTRNEIINASSGYKAGTNEAIIAAVQSELTGSRSVRLRKRQTNNGPGGAFDLQILTLQSETLQNILPPNIVSPSSARNLQLGVNPVGSLNRVSLSIVKAEEFYLNRAIEFRAVPENSGVGSEPGFPTGNGFGYDPFGLQSFGIGDEVSVGASEYYFTTPFYFGLDPGDPLTTMVDVSYKSGTNDSILVSAHIELFKEDEFGNFISLNDKVGTTDEQVKRGDLHHITGRSEAINSQATFGRFVIRFKNVGPEAVIHIGHFGARKEVNDQWVPRSADPVRAVIDRGAKPDGLMLWHGYSTSSWDNLENGGATTWNDLEAKPSWVDVEELNN